MTLYSITAPNGVTYQTEGPPNATPEQVKAVILRAHPDAATPKESAGIGSQIAEGVATTAEPFTRLLRGTLGGLKGVTDFFGAGNAASEFLQGAQEGITEHLLSSRTVQQEQERGKRLQGKGFWDTLKALPGEVLEDPGMLADLMGSAVPAIAAGALTAPEGGIGAVPVLASGLTGAVMGAGTVKGSIYDATKSELMKAGVDKERATRAAEEAQAYTGKNIDMIALGGALGAIAADTGIEPALIRTIAGRIIGKSVGREATEGVIREGLEQSASRFVGEEIPQVATRSTLRATAAEAIPEGLQGGQAQLAQNLALQREGFDRDTWQDVGGATAEAGLLGGLLGAGIHGAMRLTPRGEEPLSGETEQFAPEATDTRGMVLSRLSEAAGPDLTQQAVRAVNAVERSVSNAITMGTPEEIAKARSYLDDLESSIDAGQYHSAVSEALQRPKLDADGNPMVDENTGKPDYEGVLTEARNILQEAMPPAEAVRSAEAFTPREYVDRYMAGEGRGDTPADLEMQQYAANNAAEIEAEFARRAAERPEQSAAETTEPDYENHPLMQVHNERFDTLVSEAANLGHVSAIRAKAKKLIGEEILDPSVIDDVNDTINREGSGYKTDAARGALIDAIEKARSGTSYGDVIDAIDREAEAQRTAAKEAAPPPPIEEIKVPEEEAAAAPAEGKKVVEPDTLTPPDEIPPPDREGRLTELKSAPNWLIKYADQFGQAPELDAWVKSTLGYDVLPEQLETASKLNRLQTKQAGGERLLQRNYFDPIVELAGKLKVSLGDIGLHLWAEDALERNPEIAKRNENFPEGGAGLTTAQALEIQRAFKEEGLLPKLNQIANKAYELRDHMIEQQRKAGLLSDEEAKTLQEGRAHYMPLKGFAAEGDMMTSFKDEDNPHNDKYRAEAIRAIRTASPTGRVSEFRKAFGRGTMPFHPLFNLFNDAEAVVRRSTRMEAAQPILRAYKMDPSAFDGILNVYTDKNRKQVLVNPAELGGGYKPVESMAQEYRSNPDKYLMVKDKGVPHYIEFSEEGAGAELRRMFFNMNPKEMQGALQTLATTNNFLKGLLTYRNPLYLVTVAPFRDITDALATAVLHQNTPSSPAFRKNLATKVLKYVADPATWGAVRQFVRTNKSLSGESGRLMEEFVREGGSPLHTRFLNAQEKADAAAQAIRQLQGLDNLSPKKQAAALKDRLAAWVDGLADVVDMIPRFATYRAATDLGIRPSAAADLALDSSLNLTRRGEMARTLDLAIPFFGANIEGSRKAVRVMKNPRAASKILGSLIAYGVMETMWNAHESGDSDDDGEPDYLDLDRGAGLRMSRMVIYYGSGPDDYIKVPIGQMLGYFKFVGNKIGDVMIGNSSPAEASVKTMDAMKELTLGLISLFSPARIPSGDIPSVMTAFTPLVGKPLIENAFNRNFFGSPIYSEAFPGGAPRSELGRASTADLWKSIARAVNALPVISGGSEAVSGKLDYQPEVYRHLVESYLGGPYQLAKQVAGLSEAEGVTDVPGVKSFVGTGAKYAPQSKYFENSAVIRQIMGRLSKLTPEQAAAQGQKYFTDTDPRVISAYKAVEANLDRINKEQKATLRPDLSAKDRQMVLDHYLAERNRYYSAFNAVYNAAKLGR